MPNIFTRSSAGTLPISGDPFVGGFSLSQVFFPPGFFLLRTIATVLLEFRVVVVAERPVRQRGGRESEVTSFE